MDPLDFKVALALDPKYHQIRVVNQKLDRGFQTIIDELYNQQFAFQALAKDAAQKPALLKMLKTTAYMDYWQTAHNLKAGRRAIRDVFAAVNDRTDLQLTDFHFDQWQKQQVTIDTLSASFRAIMKDVFNEAFPDLNWLMANLTDHRPTRTGGRPW